MGINNKLYDSFKCIIDRAGFKLDSSIKMIELGNQFFFKGNSPHIAAKLIFQEMGVNHLSVDINGQDGAISLDLTKEIVDERFKNGDIVTNFGTSEHIMKDGQYMLFKNVHNFCRINGLFVHAIPPVGTWPLHCYCYYTREFVANLCKVCKYEIILLDDQFLMDSSSPQSRMILCACKKTLNDFIGRDEFYEIFDMGR